MKKSGWISVIIAIIVVGGIIFFNQMNSGEPQVVQEARPVKGFLAPDFTLKNEQGEDVTLSQYRGKAVFINFWASWCPPCQVEMPYIQQAYEKYKDDVVFLGVNLTFNDSRTEAVGFMKKNGYQMPILFDDNPKQQETIASLYRANSIPTSVFIDKNGVIQQMHLGAMDYATIEANIKKAMGE